MDKLKNQRGIALILAIIVVTMVSILLTSYVAVVISEKRRTEHETAIASANYIARAGLEQAFFDLSAEYGKDTNWTDDDRINDIIINDLNGNGVVDAGEGMPDITDGDNNQTTYQLFYNNVPFSDGAYTAEISFLKQDCPVSCAFRLNRLWVRSSGTVTSTGDTVTLTQVAKVRPVKNVTQEILYDTLDYNDVVPESAVDTAASAAMQNEIRIAGEILSSEAISINIPNIVVGDDLVITGGYGYDFTDGSRDPSLNQSIIKGSLVISGDAAATVRMGGVTIE